MYACLATYAMANLSSKVVNCGKSQSLWSEESEGVTTANCTSYIFQFFSWNSGYLSTEDTL